MKIKELLNLSPNILKVEKEIALSELINVKQKDLIIISEEQVSNKVEKLYKSILVRLEKEPIQYILNKAHFFGYTFYVDKNVLIPRPETERLVEKTNELINIYFKDNIKIIEVGTGSGCIAISLKKLDDNYDITSIDISEKALEIANKNAKQNRTTIKFIKNDLLNNIIGKYDVLISNPPYIEINSKEIEKKVKDNEPRLALYGGDDGLYFYREIIKQSKKVLNKKNLIAFEIGSFQKEEVIKIAKKIYPASKIISENDYNNLNRYIYIINE